MTEKEKKEFMKELEKKINKNDSSEKMKNVVNKAWMLLILVIAVIITYNISAKLHTPKKAKIDEAFISAKLENISELATAELEYTGIIVYSQGNIPFITQTGFNMIYTAGVKAGIDLSEMEIEVTNDKVIVNIPHAKILSVQVYTDSIEFYDELHSIFNWSDKYDIKDAILAAEEDVAGKVQVYELMEKADEQTKAVIEDILKESIGDKTLEINYIEERTK
ncbi:MAG: DUF4230 domain-containing protein [Lachnospiraceae bacterium]|nr:DUF4230 domain-containing protein [Lachnospiraceae bacterium]